MLSIINDDVHLHHTIYCSMHEIDFNRNKTITTLPWDLRPLLGIFAGLPLVANLLDLPTIFVDIYIRRSEVCFWSVYWNCKISYCSSSTSNQIYKVRDNLSHFPLFVKSTHHQFVYFEKQYTYCLQWVFIKRDRTFISYIITEMWVTLLVTNTWKRSYNMKILIIN